ncbi:MAG: RNA-binding protein [Candidatus Rokubacteria bacterium]|nr:RNA-binding protein [Candidatus Rokubacteria bacterium]MBI2156168.1 RNA-binding protein [Candidatus Rokubacteria bacterium]MBI4255763.1 RNA-binding protein [Candidatus Rokubacteria bacterium]
MGVRLFVGGLSFSTTNEGLHGAFAKFGVVESARVMTDRETGKSRGFAFVEMATEEEANRAINGLNGTSLDGRTIRIDRAMPRGSGAPPRPAGGPRPPMGGGYGGPRRGPGGGPGYGGGAPPSTDEKPRAGRSSGAGRRGEKPRRPGDDQRPKPGAGRPQKQRRSDDRGRRSMGDAGEWR